MHSLAYPKKRLGIRMRQGRADISAHDVLLGEGKRGIQLITRITEMVAAYQI